MQRQIEEQTAHAAFGVVSGEGRRGVAAARKLPRRKDSQAKLDRIIDAAIRLLDRHSLQEVTMTIVAAEAQIPRTSIYDFFPTVFSLYDEVARQHVSHSWHYVRNYTRRHAPQGLFSLLEAAIDGAAEYFNTHAAARKTLLGPGVFELHAVDAEFDILAARMYREFHNPTWPVEPLSEADPFRTVALLETAIYSASVQRHGLITPLMVEQAKLAARGYFTATLAAMGITAI